MAELGETSDRRRNTMARLPATQRAQQISSVVVCGRVRARQQQSVHGGTRPQTQSFTVASAARGFSGGVAAHSLALSLPPSLPSLSLSLARRLATLPKGCQNVSMQQAASQPTHLHINDVTFCMQAQSNNDTDNGRQSPENVWSPPEKHKWLQFCF